MNGRPGEPPLSSGPIQIAQVRSSRPAPPRRRGVFPTHRLFACSPKILEDQFFKVEMRSTSMEKCHGLSICRQVHLRSA
jgi:hypothetical protein